MKVKFIFIFCLFCVRSSFAQSDEEITKRFFDSLKMKDTYVIGKDFVPFGNSSLQGKLFTNEDLKNKITVINFWFEACAPCVAETDALNKLYSDFRANNNFQFISFTFDKSDAIKIFTDKNKIQYPIISISRDSCYLLNFKSGFPTTIVTDEKGKIAYYSCGGLIEPELAKEMIKKNVYPILKDLLVKLK